MALVYDFTAIAKHLRRDDFYTPTPREPEADQLCYHCSFVLSPRQERWQMDGKTMTRCVNCWTINEV